MQTSIFNTQPYAQKDHDSGEIFVMGAAQHAAPMTKILLLLWSFCASNLSLKIAVCKKRERRVAAIEQLLTDARVIVRDLLIGRQDISQLIGLKSKN